MNLKKAIKQIKNNKLTYLKLRRNAIGPAGAQAIAEALENNTTLTYLDLGDNRIGPAGAQAIAEALKDNTTLASLELEGNYIRAEGAPASADALANNTTLTYLHLGLNRIGAAGAQAIAEALENNTTLTSLNLWHNRIGAEDAQAIAEALKSNTTLTYLDLEDNRIGAEGAQAIAEALKDNTTLTYLNLSWNSIDDAGAQAIADALKTNTTLTSLKLELNPIDDKEASKIANLLKRNQTTIKYFGSTIKTLNSLTHTKDLSNDKVIAEINETLDSAFNQLEQLKPYPEVYQVEKKTLNSAILDLYTKQGDLRSALKYYQETRANVSNTSASNLGELLFVNNSIQSTPIKIKAVIGLMMQDFKNEPASTLLPKLVAKLLQPSRKNTPLNISYKDTTAADALVPLSFLKQWIKDVISEGKLAQGEQTRLKRMEKHLKQYPPDTIKEKINQNTALKKHLEKKAGSANIVTFESLLTHPESFTKDPKALKALQSHKKGYHDTLDELITKLDARQPVVANLHSLFAQTKERPIRNSEARQEGPDIHKPILTAVDTALTNYKNFHKKIKHSRRLFSNSVSYSRGKAGFLLRFRHTQKGVKSAEAFRRGVENQPEKATTLINDFLSNDSTNFHRHSFSAYLLDELKKIEHSPWSDISPEDNNKYKQDTMLKQLKP